MRLPHAASRLAPPPEATSKTNRGTLLLSHRSEEKNKDSPTSSMALAPDPDRLQIMRTVGLGVSEATPRPDWTAKPSE